MIHITVLLPHYGTGKMSAYSVAQLIKYSGNHNVDIVVIDNKSDDGSIEYLDPFMEHITIIKYPLDKLQSHGVAFDYILPFVKTDYFITIESDSFPTKEGWLDYYENLINQGFDMAGSKLQLSGGEYLHPCGALYKTSLWHEAKAYVDTIPYNYYPNFMMRDNFPVHTMIHKSLVEEISNNPSDWVELASGYKGDTKKLMQDAHEHYSPVGTGVFHNGMGGKQERLSTYGQRTIESEKDSIILTSKHQKLIGRMGYEPGQWLSYYAEGIGKKICYIPTETKWINNQPGVQQDYTLMGNGFKHCWGVSAYKDVDPNNEIAKIKQRLPEMLYDSLPAHQKIKTT